MAASRTGSVMATPTLGSRVEKKIACSVIPSATAATSAVENFSILAMTAAASA